MNTSISIIIPSYNEEQLLPVCLESILKQKSELGPQGEIIIAVNGSTDATLEIAHLYENNHAIVKVIHLEEADKKHAMNAALAKVTNRYAIFCDADSFLDYDAISQVKTAFNENQYAIVGAIRRPLVNTQLVNITFADTYFMLHYAKRLSLETKDRLSVQGWLMAIDLHKFDRLQFPLDNSADDIWLSAYTWMTLGQEFIGYIPHAIGTYVPPSTPEDIERQLLRHRSNHKTVQDYHPELTPYFVARKSYYTAIESGLQWKAASINLGIDFDTWATIYQNFLAHIDAKIAQSEYKYGEHASWDRISSSKQLQPQ